jgi:two-component system, NtrC family, sensor kinase
MNSNSSEKNNTVKPVTILIVDDEETVTFVVGEVMEMAAYTPIVCDCGKSALAIIERQPIDLVILDIMLPDIDGYEVAKKMKSFFGKDNFVPIIMLTGLSGIDNKITGLEYADDYIAKPFSQQELLARVKVMLRIRALHQELVVSKSQFQFLYENVPYLYASIDETGTLRNCNIQFCRKAGLSKTDMVGKLFYSFFRPQDHEALRWFIQGLQSGEKSDHHTILTLAPAEASFEPLWVSLTGVYRQEKLQGRFVEIVMQDITRNIKLEQEQRDARKQMYLSARLASIGTLAAGVAHELNNPLTAIHGCSGALLSRIRDFGAIEDKDEFIQYLTIINSQTLRCRDIIENLSKLARETGVGLTVFPLKECVDKALQLIIAKSRKKNIMINSEISDVLTVKADSNKIEQVLIHVLSNCLDFCASGNEVTITAWSSDSATVTLLVADNGPGISPENLPKVFDPFFTTKEVGQGAGLGLAISHSLMEECNGTITIESEPGEGAKIFIGIPHD